MLSTAIENEPAIISNDDKMCEIRIKSDDVSIFDNQEPPQQIHFPYYMSGVVAVKKTIQ